MRIVTTATERHQPDPAWTFADSPAHHAAQRRLASVVGLVALLLPALLWTSSDCFRASLSSYYFASVSGDLLVASLAVIATCLVAFTGESRLEFWLTTGAAAAAMGVALIPTANPGCALGEGYRGRFVAGFTAKDGVLILGPQPPGEDWFAGFQAMSRLHDLSAALLLLFLAYLCFFAFTRTVPARHLGSDGRLTRVKKARDAIYRGSGAVIVAAILLMAWGAVLRGRAGSEVSWWDAWRLTFWVEAMALWAFGLAWIVKGRLFGLALRDPGEVTS